MRTKHNNWREREGDRCAKMLDGNNGELDMGKGLFASSSLSISSASWSSLWIFPL